MNTRRFFIGRAGGFLLLVLLAGVFFLVGSFIYTEKQGDDELIPSDGDYIGFIRSSDRDGDVFEYDDAVWLTGDLAVSTALREGDCAVEEANNCLPNGYYLYNKEQKSISVPVSRDLTDVILMTYVMEETGRVEEVRVPLLDFVLLISDTEESWNTLPYAVTFKDGVITAVKEIYIP